ncbi:ACP S-malonyltransferase [Elongatibacter sediminis]|uniref:Malonyl CoA-acyl carrier protein transacylase n=1 Tax=Elongatibacter sediminis TaxID=3119006 RepID=A0AAW9R9T9_9GAMM
MNQNRQKTAFLFPGQGSQSVGMLADLARHSPWVKNTFDEASQVLGYNLWELTLEGPAERLNQTEVTQPAMLAAGVATWRVWRDLGGFEPDLMAGHSLGEYSALVAAGNLEFGTAVAVVAERARLMQAATPAGTGAMAAIIGLEDTPLREACEAAAQGQVVSCANFNSPGQTVIAGDKDAVERACALALEAGARRAVNLPVSVPSHCALMRSASRELEITLVDTGIQPGSTPVLHNADVQAHTGADSIREALVKQLWQPVRWAETIREMESRGVTRFAECGPGKVLAGLNRRISRGAEIKALTDFDALQTTLNSWSS